MKSAARNHDLEAIRLAALKPRLLRVLGVNGWLRWRLVTRTETHTTWALTLACDLEDFGVC